MQIGFSFCIVSNYFRTTIIIPCVDFKCTMYPFRRHKIFFATFENKLMMIGVLEILICILYDTIIFQRFLPKSEHRIYYIQNIHSMVNCFLCAVGAVSPSQKKQIQILKTFLQLFHLPIVNSTLWLPKLKVGNNLLSEIWALELKVEHR